MPRPSAAVPEGVTRTFWLTVKVPADAAAGVYRGTVRLAAERGGTLTLPLQFTVRKGTLDPVDIPAGPFGHTIDLPWYEDEAADWNRDMAVKSLKKLREYGFTTASGLPVLTYHGFKDGVPQIDFSARRRPDEAVQGGRLHACRSSATAPFDGLDTYYQDEAAMRAAGFTRLQRVHQGGIHGGAEARRRGGLAAGLLEHRRRADRRRRDPQRRERRGVPQGVPQGAALLHGGQLVHRAPTPRTRTSGCRRRCTSSAGTCTTRRG